MLNRVLNTLDEIDLSGRTADRPWRVDANPARRCAWLFAVLVVPLVVVFGRLAWLQGSLADEFAAAFEFTTESLEPIPSRDGRILSADGRVLAFDVERFVVQAHYRWLEQRADEDWLRQQALSRLTRTRRRDRARVEAEMRNVLARRDEMWDRLGELTGLDRETLDERRAAIQRRVERIVASVENRERQRKPDEAQLSPAAAPSETKGGDRGIWRTVWQAAVRALTTPPERERRDLLVVKEELQYHDLLVDVPRETAAEIEAHPERYPGLRIEVTTERSYPAGPLAPHVIGSRLRISDDELEARQRRFPHGDPLDYRPGDRIGKTGVERAYDRHLRGLRGQRRIVRDRRGEIVRTEVVREPRIGRDVVLTLNLPLQENVEQLLDEAIGESSVGSQEPPAGTSESGPGPSILDSRPAGGCIVALDVHTGAVVVAASAPRFDLMQLVDPDPETWQRLNADPRRPFFPRATQMALPPGSVFKTLSAVALLESGRFDPDETFHCQGFLDRPDRHRCYIYRHHGVGHGETELCDALCRSCNVYFYAAARQVGPEPIVTWAERFGFGQPTGIDLPGEQAGNLPRPRQRSEVRGQKSEVRSQGSGVRGQTHKARGQHPAEDHLPLTTHHSLLWYPGDTLGLAIGQSRLTVTPMQIARMMAAVANGGRLVRPHVVRGFGPAVAVADSSQSVGSHGAHRIAGLNDGTLERVREGLRKVVEDPAGTGYKYVRLEGIAIAGKTGTAEVAGKPDHAWFAGYVPADNPRIAFVVVLEHAGSGGREAGPVARRLVQAMLESGILQLGGT